MADNRFEDRYRSGNTPWDHGMVGLHLPVDAVTQALSKTLPSADIGCGTGENAIWLARQGFSVVACDFSQPPLTGQGKIGRSRRRCLLSGGRFPGGHHTRYPFRLRIRPGMPALHGGRCPAKILY